jgi:Domain of unknown function (DUF4158)
VPVDFLSDEQGRRYGRFDSDPSPEQLARFFTIGPDVTADVDRRRSDAMRLGYATQLETVRFLGTFLSNVEETPVAVVAFVAAQIEVDPAGFKAYSTSRARQAHTTEIRDTYGYVAFGEGHQAWSFLRWLYERAWTSNERPSVLVDRSTAWLVEHHVLLPGVSRLTRLVSQVRERANQRAWRHAGGQLEHGAAGRLDHLVELDPTSGVTHLERLRRPPRNPSIEGLVAALDRLGEIAELDVATIDLSSLPAARVRALVADTATGRVQQVERREPRRRAATLAAFAVTALAFANDDVIDIYLAVISTLLSRTERAENKHRLASLAELDAAARVLAAAAAVVLDRDIDDPDIRPQILSAIGEDALAAAVALVTATTDPGDKSNTRRRFLSRYPLVRRFLPTLLDTVTFDALTPGHRVLAALDHLRATEVDTADWESAPREVINASWRSVAVVDGAINHRGYVLCVCDRLRSALRRRDVLVPAADRHLHGTDDLCRTGWTWWCSGHGLMLREGCADQQECPSAGPLPGCICQVRWKRSSARVGRTVIDRRWYEQAPSPRLLSLTEEEQRWQRQPRATRS